MPCEHIVGLPRGPLHEVSDTRHDVDGGESRAGRVVGDPSRPVHGTLLAAGVPIVEHMTNLTALPSERFHFHAAPLAIVGGALVTVRAYAVVTEPQERYER